MPSRHQVAKEKNKETMMTTEEYNQTIVRLEERLSNIDERIQEETEHWQDIQTRYAQAEWQQFNGIWKHILLCRKRRDNIQELMGELAHHYESLPIYEIEKTIATNRNYKLPC